MYSVEAGHRAVIFDLLHDGVLSDVKGEGTHFVIPVIQRPIFYDVRSKPRNIAVVTGSKGQLFLSYLYIYGCVWSVVIRWEACSYVGQVCIYSRKM